MFKVLHIVLGLKVGGLERFVMDLCDSYKYTVSSMILCLDDPNANPQFDDKYNVVRWAKEPGLSLKLPFLIASFIKKNNIDLVHTHNPSPHFYGALSGLLTKIPVVHTKHGRNYPSDYKKVLLNRISSLLSAKIVAVSKDAADVAISVEKVNRNKVSTILNGIDCDKFTPRKGVIDRSMWGRDENVALIGIVARLSSEKNHELLIDACLQLFKKKIGFCLVIVGDGPLRDTLERYVDSAGLRKNVIFAGLRNDIAEIMQSFDIFALSSTTEGVSLTLLEAMGCALPVVATNVGGNPEVVDNNISGYIVEQDPLEFSDRLIDLINSKSLRGNMGLAGRKRVLELFSLTQTSSQYLTLYREVLGNTYE